MILLLPSAALLAKYDASAHIPHVCRLRMQEPWKMICVLTFSSPVLAILFICHFICTMSNAIYFSLIQLHDFPLRDLKSSSPKTKLRMLVILDYILLENNRVLLNTIDIIKSPTNYIINNFMLIFV